MIRAVLFYLEHFKAAMQPNKQNVVVLELFFLTHEGINSLSEGREKIRGFNSEESFHYHRCVRKKLLKCFSQLKI